MTEEGSARAMAMVEFVGTFASLSGASPESLSELSDGVALFEALSEMYVPLVGYPAVVAFVST